MNVTTNADEQKKILNRLRRAQGQLGAVIAAVENAADCNDVVTQLAAVSSAIDRAGFQIIACAMRDSLGAERAGVDGEDASPQLGQLERMFMSLA
jgi:DNA-binding FrmR family transcriptional regulator